MFVYMCVAVHPQVVTPSVAIVENVMRAAHTCESVRRVVHTSSMAAVRCMSQAPLNGAHYTAEDWNTVAQATNPWPQPYQYAKVRSERVLWDLAHKYGVDTVSVCPSMVFGPNSYWDITSLQQLADEHTTPTSSTVSTPHKDTVLHTTTPNLKSLSVQIVREYIRGERPVESRLISDVRDVANALICACECESASMKRYIASEERRVSAVRLRERVIETLEGVDACHSPSPSQVLPVVSIPWRDVIGADEEFSPAIPIGMREVDASDIVRDLGCTFRPTDDTISDMVAGLYAMGVEGAAAVADSEGER